MTQLDASWLADPGARSVTGMLTEAGHQALFVGGCVRNALLGAPVSDLDIATDATPEQVLNLAADRKLKALPTGIDHGTITVISGGNPFEVTTFRKDIETDGRRAKVVFTDDVTKDAQRRDFTMNALYVDPAGHLIDPLHGLPDIEAGRLRFIGDPKDRIREDYLRILRFFRFHAWYARPDGGFDPDALAACAELGAGLDHISKERIGSEIYKLLSAPDPSVALGGIARSGVLTRVLPGADPKAAFIVIASGMTDPIVRLAAMGALNPATDLRLSKADATRLDRLRNAATSDHKPAEIGYRLGANDGVAAVHLRAAFLEHPIIDTDLSDVERGASQVFPIKAGDLMPEYQGPTLGARLQTLERLWVGSDFKLTKSQLLRH